MFRTAVLALSLSAFMAGAMADEAAIRKNLTARYPELKIDEISKTPIAGVYELRTGTDVVYSDAEGSYLLEGNLIDVKARKNLTQERVNKLSSIDFKTLPLQDAIVWKSGNGARKLVVFADPNCGYCKRFEKTLQNVKDVTVYTFLYPILGGDSPEKAKAIWCAKDNTSAWRDWMLNGTPPPRLLGNCATPLDRNVTMGQKFRINGTPAIFFEDGSRVPGAMGAADVEKQFETVGKKS